MQLKLFRPHSIKKYSLFTENRKNWPMDDVFESQSMFLAKERSEELVEITELRNALQPSVHYVSSKSKVLSIESVPNKR